MAGPARQLLRWLLPPTSSTTTPSKSASTSHPVRPTNHPSTKSSLPKFPNRSPQQPGVANPASLRLATAAALSSGEHLPAATDAHVGDHNPIAPTGWSSLSPSAPSLGVCDLAADDIASGCIISSAAPPASECVSLAVPPASGVSPVVPFVGASGFIPATGLSSGLRASAEPFFPPSPLMEMTTIGIQPEDATALAVAPFLPDSSDPPANLPTIDISDIQATLIDIAPERGWYLVATCPRGRTQTFAIVCSTLATLQP